MYRLVYQPLVDASVLVLLIASVALHFALTGLALVFFVLRAFSSGCTALTEVTLPNSITLSNAPMPSS